MDAYTSIKIHIRPWDKTISAYPVEAFLDQGAGGTFRKGELRLDLSALLKAENSPKEYGRLLFKSLFTGDILKAYHKATSRAEVQTDRRLRVQLSIDEGSPELHALSWERLYHEHGGHAFPLATETLVPFSRYTDLDSPEREPISERPIRLLIAISNPSNLPVDLPPIDVEREIEYLLLELGDLKQEKQVQVTLMHGRTPLSPELQKRLNGKGYRIEKDVTSLDNLMQRLPGYHVFHFLGHGRFKSQSQHNQGTTIVFLEKEDGTYTVVTDEELILKIATADLLPHLVFLDTCESTRREAEAAHPFVGLGPRLVQVGVPAVVAMQGRITMDLARKVMSKFYHRLLEHGIVDRALNEARRLIFEQDVIDWAIPVLFMRLAQGQLFTSESTRPTPFPARPLPLYFVPRPNVTKALKEALRLTEKTDGSDMPIASVIHGMGGIGKSTLVLALAKASTIRQHFIDGVLWITLGQEPESNLLSSLGGWIMELGDKTYLPTNVQAASNHLRALLQNKAVLLVVDDAWDLAHVKPFEVGGPQCRMLITTREASIASQMGVMPYNLDVMSSEQALELLTKRLAYELKDKERDEALSLANMVGNLPLALELAAAQVGSDVSWAILLKELSEEIAHLEALDSPEVGRDKIDDDRLKELSLIASFNLSLRRLPEKERRMFAWLGVLPHDVTLTPAMTMTLWNTTEQGARITLLYLHRKALIQGGIPLPDGTLTFRLHGLQHAIARRLLIASPDTIGSYNLTGFGLSHQGANTTLLVQYKDRAEDSRWYKLPDDGYIYTHLTWHMEKAGNVGEIHTLLSEEDSDRNAWFNACERLGLTTGFLDDIFRAWKLAEQNSEKCIHQGKLSTSVSQEVYYALVVASINTLAQNIPPVLLTALVKEQVWRPTQALAYARRIPELEQRAIALVGLAPYLAESMQNEIQREALSIARIIETEQVRTKVLSTLALQLAEQDNAEKALEAAKTIRNTADQAAVLVALIPQLKKLGYTEKVLKATRSIKNVKDRITALTGLIPHLEESLRSKVAEEAWAEVGKIKRDWKRVWLSAKLAPYLPDLTRSSALHKVMAAVQDIRNEIYQAQVLLDLAQYMPNEVAKLGWKIRDKQTKMKVLMKLSLYLPKNKGIDIQRDLLMMIRNISDQVYRANLLTELTPYLFNQLHDSALELVRGFEDQSAQLSTLIALVPHLSESYRANILPDALTAVQALENGLERAEKLVELTPSLPESLRHQALARIYWIRDPKDRIDVLARLVPHLSVQRLEILNEALATAQEIDDKLMRTQYLVHFIPYLSNHLLLRALRMIQSINDRKTQSKALWDLHQEDREEDRDEKLARLASRLMNLDYLRQTIFNDKEAQSEALWDLHLEDRDEKLARLASQIVDADYTHEALVITKMISDLFKRSEISIVLASQFLESGHLLEALAAAQMINSPAYRASILRRLVTNLRDPVESTTVQEVLAATRTIEDTTARGEILIRFVPYLSERERLLVFDEALLEFTSFTEPQFVEVLAAAKTIRNKIQQAQTLSELMPRLQKVQKDIAFQEILVAVQMTDNVVRKSETLLKLLPHLSKLQIDVVLGEAQKAAGTIANAEQRTQMLMELLPHLPGVQKNDAIEKAIRAAGMIANIEQRAQMLIELLSSLSEPLKETVAGEAFEATGMIVNVQQRAQVLVELLPRLPESQKESIAGEALAAAETITHGVPWIEVLLKLMPYLPMPLRCSTDEVMLAVVRVREDKLSRGEVLIRLIKAGYTQQALTAARTIVNVEQRAQVLMELLPHFFGVQKNAMVCEALRTVRLIVNVEQRAPLLVKLLPLLVGVLKDAVVEETLTAARTNKDTAEREKVLARLTNWMVESGYLRDELEAIRTVERLLKTLTGKAVYLPEAKWTPFIIAWLRAARAIDDTPKRIEVLSELTLFLENFSPVTLHLLWRETLQVLALRTRQDLLSDIAALASVITALGGAETLGEIDQCIKNIAKWWP